MESIDMKKEFLLSGNKTGCLLIHGFTSTPAEMWELGEKLNKEEGYTVLGVRLSGHGTDVEDMEKSQYRDWIKSVEEGYQRLKKICTKVYVIGHSMGGVLALYLAENHAVDKVITLSPALVTKSKAAKYAGIAKYFMRYTEWGPEERPIEETKYLLGYNKVPLKSVQELNRLQRAIKGELKKISNPILIIYSSKDNAIDEKGIKLIEDNVSSVKVEKVILNKCGHNITIECEKEKVFKDVIEFLS
jgi:carboxylesterase